MFRKEFIGNYIDIKLLFIFSFVEERFRSRGIVKVRLWLE